LLAGGAAATAGVVHVAEAGPVPQAEEREVVAALGRIETQLRRLAEPLERCEAFTCRVTDRIRENQKQFFKVNSKFPDFLDVGVDVWESTYDWHLRTGQTPSVGRLPDGRVGMTFMLTTLVVRPDVANDFIGLGYDTR
jgi:hypothetical protein